MANPQAPAGLGPKAKKIWKETVEKFDLRADELQTLDDACREVDLIQRMQKEIDLLSSLTVPGSMKQPVISETVKEIRHHRAQFTSLMRSLKLPEDDGVPKSRSTSAREAAQARWRRGA